MKRLREEAHRWYLQASDDLKFVQWINQQGRFFDKGCFIAQQAAEKGLKACHYILGARSVHEHSAYQLARR